MLVNDNNVLVENDLDGVTENNNFNTTEIEKENTDDIKMHLDEAVESYDVSECLTGFDDSDKEEIYEFDETD